MSENLIIKKIKKLENKIDQLQQDKVKYPLWLNIDQASNYLHLCKSIIRTLVKKNKIPFTRARDSDRSKLLFNRKQLDTWLLTSEVDPNKRARKRAKPYISREVENE